VTGAGREMATPHARTVVALFSLRADLRIGGCMSGTIRAR